MNFWLSKIHWNSTAELSETTFSEPVVKGDENISDLLMKKRHRPRRKRKEKTNDLTVTTAFVRTFVR